MSGAPNDFPSLKPGGHLCLLYADDQEKIEAIAAAVADGLLHGERCVYWGTAATFAAIEARVRPRRVSNVAATREALLFFDSAKYHPSVLDVESQASSLQSAAAEARAGGFTGLRIVSDPNHKTRRLIATPQLALLERSLSQLCEDLSLTAICAFDQGDNAPDATEVALRTHESALLDGRLCTNPFFEGSGQSAAALSRAAWMTSHIATQAHARELAEAESAALILESSRSQRRDAEYHRQIAALTRAVEARDRLLITAARWLSRPLPAMCNHLEELARDDRFQPYQSALSTCDEHLAAVTRLSQGLDEIASFLQMQVVLRPESLDLVDVIRGAIAELSDEGAVAGDVMLEAPPRIHGIWDRLRLTRLFHALIRTAREQGSDGQVHLRLDDVGQLVRARIEFLLPHAPALAESGEHFRALDYGASGESDYERLAVRLWPARETVRMMGGSLGISTWADARVVFTLDLPKGTRLLAEDEKSVSSSGSEARPGRES